MAAATAISSLFQADTSNTQGFSPIASRPYKRDTFWSEQVSLTVATTSVDDIGDRVALMALPGGGWLNRIERLRSADHDTGGPTLDMDLTMWYYDAAGAVAGEVTVYDASANAPFSAAVTAAEIRILGTGGAGLQIPNPGSWAVLGYKVIAAATTPGAGVDEWVAYGGPGR